MYLATGGEVKTGLRDMVRRISEEGGQRDVELVAFDGALHRFHFRAGSVDTAALEAALGRLRAKGAVLLGDEATNTLFPAEARSRDRRALCDATRRAVERTARAFSTAAAQVPASCAGAEVWLYSPLLPRATGGGAPHRARWSRHSCSDEALAKVWRTAGEILSGTGGWLRVMDPRGVLPDSQRDQSSRRLRIGEDLSRLTGGEYGRTGGATRLRRSEAYVLTYSPDHGRDGGVHHIDVRLEHDVGFRMQWRRSYAALRAQDLEGLRAVGEALSSKAGNPLGVAVHVRSGKHHRALAVEVRVPYRYLALVPVADTLAGELLLTVFKVGTGGAQSQVVSLQGRPTVRRSQEADARHRGYFAFRFEVKPDRGEGTLHAVVTDRVSGVRSVVRVPLG